MLVIHLYECKEIFKYSCNYFSGKQKNNIEINMQYNAKSCNIKKADRKNLSAFLKISGVILS